MSRRCHQKFDFQTGTEFEVERLFPSGDRRVEMLEEAKHLPVQYQPLAEAILECTHRPTAYTGNELWDPPTKWAGELHFLIAQKLRLYDWTCLSMIPALRSSADVHHGIDFLIVYHDAEKGTEVILTVDLSLREKDEFKADVLITPTGIVPNRDYFRWLKEMHVPNLEYASKEEDRACHEIRQQARAEIIVAILLEKLQHADPHYGRTIDKIGSALHREIETLMCRQKKRDSDEYRSMEHAPSGR